VNSFRGRGVKGGLVKVSERVVEMAEMEVALGCMVSSGLLRHYQRTHGNKDFDCG
jgi:hypothetical protein